MEPKLHRYMWLPLTGGAEETIVMAKNIAVFGIYSDERSAADGVDALRVAGFRSTDVSVLLAENSGNKDLTHEKNTKAPEGAAAGAGTGAVLGGALGWLMGAGLLIIPGLGPFVAAGPIMGLLGGLGAGGAMGGIAGGLIGAGMPEYEAKRYEGRVRKGSVLLSVHCDDSQAEGRAKNILKETGALDVSAASEAKADFAASEHSHQRTTSPRS